MRASLYSLTKLELLCFWKKQLYNPPESERAETDSCEHPKNAFLLSQASYREGLGERCLLFAKKTKNIP